EGAGALCRRSRAGGAGPPPGGHLPSRADRGFARARALSGEAVNEPLKRVLFVCVGNACRSQMAEAFARVYGRDALVAASAGLNPAMAVMPDTVRAMAEKEIDLRDQFPKSIRHLGRSKFDLVVNMMVTGRSSDVNRPPSGQQSSVRKTE